MIEAILKAVQIGDSLGSGVLNSSRNEYGEPSWGGSFTDNLINPYWGSGLRNINRLGSNLISSGDKALSGLAWLGGPATQMLFDDYLNNKIKKNAYTSQTTINNTINSPISKIGTVSGASQILSSDSKKIINPAVKQYYEDEQKIRDIGTSIIGLGSSVAETGLLDSKSGTGNITKSTADKAALKAAPTTPKEATFEDTASLINTKSGNKLFDTGVGMDFYAAKGGKTMKNTKEVIAGEAGKEWLVDIKTGKIIEELAQGAEKIDLEPGTAVINQEQMDRIQNGEPFESVVASLPNVQNTDKAAEGVVDPDSWLSGFKYLYSWIPGSVKNTIKGSEQLFQVGKKITPNFNGSNTSDVNSLQETNPTLISPIRLGTDIQKQRALSNARRIMNETNPSLVYPNITRSIISENNLSKSLSNSSKDSSDLDKQQTTKSDISDRVLTYADAPITGSEKLVRMPSRSFDVNKGLISNKSTSLSYRLTEPTKKESWFKKVISNVDGEDAILAANTLYNTLAALENSKNVNSTPISNVPLARPSMVSASKINAEPLLRLQSRAFNTALTKAVQSGRTDMIPLILAANTNALQTVNESVSGRNAELENSVRGANASASNQFSLAKFGSGQDVETRNKMMQREDSLIDSTRRGQQIESLANLLYGAGQYKLNKKQRKDLETERNLYMKMLNFQSMKQQD